MLAGASSEQCLLINFPSENVFPIFPFASTPFSDASSFPHPRFRVELKHIIQFQAEAYTEHPLGGTIDAQRGWQRRAEEAAMIYSIITLQSNTNVSQFELNFFSLLAARLSGFVLGKSGTAWKKLFSLFLPLPSDSWWSESELRSGSPPQAMCNILPKWKWLEDESIRAWCIIHGRRLTSWEKIAFFFCFLDENATWISKKATEAGRK